MEGAKCQREGVAVLRPGAFAIAVAHRTKNNIIRNCSTRLNGLLPIGGT